METTLLKRSHRVSAARAALVRLELGLLGLSLVAALAGPAHVAAASAADGAGGKLQSVTVPTRYAIAWTAAVATLAARGFPLELVSRESGVITTGWIVTREESQGVIEGRLYGGRRVERVTLALRPVASGIEIVASGQVALASRQWSPAGGAPPGQLVDLPQDAETLYGILYDLSGVLGFPLPAPPAEAYSAGLPRGPVLGGRTMVVEPPALKAPAEVPSPPVSPPAAEVESAPPASEGEPAPATAPEQPR